MVRFHPLAVLKLSQNKLAGQIPSWIGNHTLFISLTLGFNRLHGPIPESIFRLPNLETLDLQENLFLVACKCGVIANINDSVALPKFQVLRLGGCNLSGEFPSFLHGQNHLEFVDLSENNIEGHIPKWFMNLGNLRYLRLSWNKLEGALPIPPRSTIIYMVSHNRLTGEIPPAICNLTSLVILQLSINNLNSKLPQCLGNISNSASVLDLRNNSFSGDIPDAFSSDCTLRAIDFSQNQLEGKIPRSLANCTKLEILNIGKNKINDVFPSWLGIFPKLRVLILRSNRLHGVIGKPRANFEFQRLQIVDLSGNCFRGKLPLEYFRNWTAMKTIYIERPLYMQVVSSFHLTGYQTTVNFDYSMTMTNKGVLTLYKKIQEFLTAIDLSSNRFEGGIPDALGDLKELYLLNLSNNLLTGRIPPSFENNIEGHIPIWFMNLDNLRYLRLSWNKLEGALPIPPRSTIIYMVSHNRLTGEIPPAICNLTSLVILQLSINNLNSKLPQCLGNISNSASVLDLRNNSFSGDIPDAFSSGCTLREIDFSQKQLEGKIPRSLANCTKVEILNIEKNKINDVFPSWLGIFPNLRVLILRSNRLHGVIGKPIANFEFQRLQIVDLSGNCFRGKLPLEYFRNWTAMKTIYIERPLYMQVVSSFHLTGYQTTVNFDYSMTMTNKGVLTLYKKIQEFLTAIDLSSNRFEGGIPDALGDLKELYLLNLSNNLLTGRIPPSLSNLKELEALDLSQNKLSGEIPVQLAQLTFLAVFNVSHNVLSGPIPRGNQFDTFDRTSFDANPGLCGKPLPRKCGNGEDSLPAAKRDEGSAAYSLEFGWKVVVIGYASGLVIGVILGCVMDTRKYEWLVKNYFARWQR
uniref:Receptor-like protein 12 n=1 Tax=Salix viminalis TaxID=40686 RepID=A0A6N2KGP4_SALVM